MAHSVSLSTIFSSLKTIDYTSKIKGSSSDMTLSTYRPSEPEWNDNLSSITDTVLVVLGALELKGIPTDNVSRSSSVGAQARGRDLSLVFL